MIRRITTGVAMLLESNSFSGLTSAQSDLIKHWYDSQSGFALPRREDIDPGALRSHLASLSIVEVAETGQVKFRLAGSGLRSILGKEMRGRFLSDLDQSLSDMWSLGLSSALERGRPVGGLIERHKDKHAWLRLPLRSAATGVLILCHDTILPKSRGVETFQNKIDNPFSTIVCNIAA